MIMGDNGPVVPQVGYYNGYSIADRLLEDVLFRFKNVDGKLTWAGFHPSHDSYMKKFSADQIEEWHTEAYNSIMEGMEMQSADGKEDLYWVPQT